MSQTPSLGLSAQTNGHFPVSIIAVEHEDRKVAVRRNQNYQQTIASIKAAFWSLEPVENKYIYLCSRFDGFDDALQVTDELWSELLPNIMLVTVALGDPCKHVCSGPNIPSGIQVSVKLPGGKSVSLGILAGATVAQLKARVESKMNATYDQHSLVFERTQLQGDSTLTSLNIGEGASLVLIPDFLFLRGKKPVVYLLPPAFLPGVKVELSLSTAWEFSALHPPTAVQTDTTPGLGQKVTWIVNAKPDGTLFNHESGREVSYIFWEAQATRTLLPSPACSRPGTPSEVESPKGFDPSRPLVDSRNSVLLPFDKVLRYIDDTLLTLGLHTEARTSFITYWLPELQMHHFLALRFVPQDQYEAVAPLTVTPAPEVTTRVFMLFRGVDKHEIRQWEDGERMRNNKASAWKDIVGVDFEKATNPSLFRVLEWGGMEVK